MEMKFELFHSVYISQYLFKMISKRILCYYFDCYIRKVFVFNSFVYAVSYLRVLVLVNFIETIFLTANFIFFLA